MNIIAKIIFDVKGDIQQRFSKYQPDILYCFLFLQDLVYPEYGDEKSNEDNDTQCLLLAKHISDLNLAEKSYIYHFPRCYNKAEIIEKKK
ncbi:MAG: hypothetical protein K6B18_03725 [Ruminococcus sp.]|nr:hypothetical protein [Ruminococcus sp.]